MTALLLRPAWEASVLSIWRHDGYEWSFLPSIQIQNITLLGKMQLNITEYQVVFSIDGVGIATFSAEEPGLLCCNQGLGIRLIGE